jgi:urocanate hydratase
MTPPQAHPAAAAVARELASVYRFYATLAREMDPESGLGGKLLYAGELDVERCRLLRAANIAGAASLTASADASMLRQSMRDGAIDFVVTSLDEALRILKNEIRTCQTVAVGVSAPHEAIAGEMLERGVLPDLLAPLPAASAEIAALMAQGARCVSAQPLPAGKRFLVWTVPDAWAARPAEFDALLLERLTPDDHANRRWLRLSPRYLDQQARRLRSLACAVDAASEWMDWMGQPVED